MSKIRASKAEVEMKDMLGIMGNCAFRIWWKLPTRIKQRVSVTDLKHEAWLYNQRFGKNNPQFRMNTYRWGIIKYLRKINEQEETCVSDLVHPLYSSRPVNNHKPLFECVDAKLDVQHILSAMQPTPTMQAILRKRFWEGKTYQAIGDELGISRLKVERKLATFLATARKRFAA